MNAIVKHIRRPERSVIEALRRYGSATVHEALGRIGAVSPTIKPLDRSMRICGPAYTVRMTPGDNLMLLRAIRDAQPGDVIVCDCGGMPECGPFGELAAMNCKVRGLEALATSGSVRDTSEILQIGFPVFCSGISIFGTVKESIGAINHPICFGGVTVNPGDVVLGDCDGVMIIPFERAQEAAGKSRERTEKEEHTMARILAGESIYDIYGYDAVLRRNECTEDE